MTNINGNSIHQSQSIDIIGFTKNYRDVYTYMMMQCLSLMSDESISISRIFLSSEIQSYYKKIFMYESGLIDLWPIIKLITVSVVDSSHITEETIATAIVNNYAYYKNISPRDIARVAVYNNTAILDVFGLQEKIIILCYLMNQKYDVLQETFPKKAVQKVIDRLRQAIVEKSFYTP